MTLYRRPPSLIWYFDITPAGGTRQRRSTGTADKAEARIIESQARLAATQAKAQPKRWRVRHLLGAYWEGHAKHKPSAATLFYPLQALADTLGPNTFVADITAAMLVRYVATRRIGKPGLDAAGKPVARLRANSSINRELAILRAAMNFAADVHQQPVPRIKWSAVRLKEPPGRVRALTFADYQRLIDACPDDELRLMVAIACASGLRRENVRQITWERIDLVDGRISVIVKGGKNFQARLSGAPLEQLRRHAASALAAIPQGQPRQLGGLAFAKPNWRRRWEAARAASGLQDFRWHDLRHTFATWARKAGVDLGDIKDAMGHQSIQMTMRYAHISPEHQTTAWDTVAKSTPFAAPQKKDEQ